MSAPAHCIRNIPWANNARAAGSSINTHNQNIYQHHLQQYAVPPKKYAGRRRSQSIRAPPIKFDPFADEPLQPSARMIYNHPSPPPSIPYTIQIPAAAPTEIQRYSSSSRRFNFSSPSPAPPQPQHQRAAAPLPPPPQPQSATRMTGALSGPNVSKLVAGILLNRVHAVGKPMRRRAAPSSEREYVKSSLSACISVEA